MNLKPTNILQPIGQSHQSDNPSSADEIYSTKAKLKAKETKSPIKNNFSNDWQNKSFSILDHIDKLEPAKGSDCAERTSRADRYICPVCGGNDLTIETKTGKYQCWHGCECSDIREAVSPWSEIVASNNNGFYPHQKQRSKRSGSPELNSGACLTAHSAPKKPTLPCPLPKGKITLARLPEAPTDSPRVIEKPPIPQWATEKYKIPQDCDREIIYQYSKTQWISRYEWSDPTHPKGHKKHPHPKHLDDQGNQEWNKGKSQWQAYRIDEAILI